MPDRKPGPDESPTSDYQRPGFEPSIVQRLGSEGSSVPFTELSAETAKTPELKGGAERYAANLSKCL